MIPVVGGMSEPALKVDAYNREMFSWGTVVRPERLEFILADCKRMLRQGAGDLGAVHATMGHIYARLANWEKAVHHYRNAVQFAPSRATFKISLGASLITVGQPTKGLEFLGEATEQKDQLSPYDLVIAYANAAEALAKLGMEQDAYDAMRDAIEVADFSNPTHVIALAIQCAEIGADWEAVELFARYCALVQGVSRGTLHATALIKSAPSDVLETLELPYARRLSAAVDKVATYGLQCAPIGHRAMTQPMVDGDQADALAVFHDMAPLREQANATVMGAGNHA